MDPTDDTTPTTDTTTPDPSQVVDDGATPPELEPPRAEPEDRDARALAAMDKGLEVAKQATVGDDGEINLPHKLVPKARKKSNAPVPRETPAETPPATGEPPVPGTPEAAAAAQDPSVVSPAVPPPPTDADKAIDEEVAKLQIKDKTQGERVRKIVADNHAKAAALAKFGVVEEADLPAALQRFEHATAVLQGAVNTGATGEMYGNTLAYLEMSVGGNAGNMKAAEAALNVATQEVAHWSKILGREVPGVFDPLAEHKDLQDDIEGGLISRERALELAAFRAGNVLNAQQRDRFTAQQQEERTAASAYQDLQKFDQALLADPVYATYLRPALDAEVRKIRAQYPAAEWLPRTQATYELLKRVPIPRGPVPAGLVTPRTPTPNQPVQTKHKVPGPAGGTPIIEPKIPKDPMLALEMGLAKVAQR